MICFLTDLHSTGCSKLRATRIPLQQLSFATKEPRRQASEQFKEGKKKTEHVRCSSSVPTIGLVLFQPSPLHRRLRTRREGASGLEALYWALRPSYPRSQKKLASMKIATALEGQIATRHRAVLQFLYYQHQLEKEGTWNSQTCLSGVCW